MSHHHFPALVASMLSALCTLSAVAQVAQSPLLAKTSGQVPNIVFMFDDSGSMPKKAIYQYGGSAGGFGMTGPRNNVSLDDLPTPASDNPYAYSPNVNLMYYDPRETYARRVNADGSLQAAGSTSGISSFNVYFHNPGSTTSYRVSSVRVDNVGRGYPASGVTGTFTAAPSGGTTATATVTTATSGTAGSVTVNAGGANYPATGVTATFSAPSTGGTPATGTVTIGTSGNISAVVPVSGGSGYDAGVTATFSAPTTPGGITATGTVTTSGTSRTVSTISVTNGGSGYVNGSTVTFSTAPTGGISATGTVNTVSYNVSSGNVLITNPGSGYTAATATITGTLAPWGTASTCTVTRRANTPPNARGIASINCTAGSGYTSVPTLSFSGTGGSGAAFGALATTSTTDKIVSINVTNGGSYLTANPTVSSISGGGSGASFNITTGTTRRITGITITNGGSGYTANPTITLSSPGSGATFNVTRGTTNVVTAINITNPGSGYISAPTITLLGAGSGAGASFSVALGTTNVIQSVNITNPGTGYLTPPTFTITSSPGAGASFTVNTSSTVVAGVNQDWNGTGTVTGLGAYFTPGYTPDAGSPLSIGATVLAYPNTASSATANYPKFRNRTDCTTSATSCTWAEERQNYANWLAYHSTRLRLAQTGIGLAFQPLPATFRLGWATIGNDLDDNNRLAAGVRLYDTTTRNAFFTWLYARTATGNTPNRIALNKVGGYYQRKDDNGPWGASPPIGSTSTNPTTGTANPNHASCRRNYALLMTDGYYNDTFTQTDTDSTPAQVNAAGVTYTPSGPYSDTTSGTSFSNSFADVAFKYWFNSLRPDLPQNKLTAKPTDSATWPHMNFYAVGLGILGTLDSTDPAVLTSLTSPGRTRNWPAPTESDPRAIDDMWHATINGRGLLLNAGTASKLQKAILQIISDVSGLEDTQAGVAASATSLTSTTRKFTPLFTSQNWTGNVKSFSLDPVTADEIGLAWEVESVVSTDPLTGVSTYASKIPSHSTRNVVVGNGATSGARAVSFTKSAMDSAGLTGAMTGTVTNDLINYLRGDSSLEATKENELNAAAIYRPRQTRLGDIVNSTPVFVKGELDQKYQTVPGVSGYSAFVANKKAQRTEGVLFVGANDGMLHAFRDGASAAGGNSPTSSAGGIEVFAYVPRAVLPTLHLLANPTYGADATNPHRYYVDGPSVEVDSYLPTANRWANIVLGSTGAGTGNLVSTGTPRTGVFAIDTTGLNTSVTSLSASNVLWEVGSNLPAFSELGFVTDKIEAGPMLDGSWVAVFGNGFESTSCKAQLFIVNMETGALIKKIDTGAGTCGANKNGLTGVALVRNANQQIIGAYAGDLLGNVWKFNLNSSSSSNWKVDFGGDPLYKTRTGQPITAAPTVFDLATTAAATTPKPGYMVVFKTGKLIDSLDLTTTTTQTIYGVWDNKMVGADSTATGAVRFTEAQLAPRTIANIADGTNAVDYATKKGWYYNMVNSGERMIYRMNPVLNRFVLGTSVTPTSSSAADPCISGTGGEGRRYFLDALSGGSVNSTIMVVPPEPPPPPFIDPADPTVNMVISISSDAKGITEKVKCELTNTCAAPVSSGVKRRQWRQLFPR